MANAALVSRALLTEHLSRDAPLRERAIARFMVGVTAVCCVLACAVVPLIGSALAGALIGTFGILIAYYALQVYWLGRGRFHPVLPWTNVTIEVSAPAVIFVLDAHFRGPEYALTAPPLVIWGGLIALCAIRAQPSLALMAGALAAVEYLGLYFAVARPALQTDLVTLSPLFIAIRSVLLFCCGVLTAISANHLVRKATELLAAIRERDLFGKYVLHERLGVGGMAEVFRATYCPEGGFRKPVALKRILPAYAEDPEFLRLFQREAEICSQLSHPNIVQVFDLGSHDGVYYLAMQFVEGPTLRALLKSGVVLPLAAITFIGAELAAALDHLRRATALAGTPLGLIHRDVNPPNILVSRLGEVKLTDFGIARAAAKAQVTLTHGVRGKAGYMSPEQVTGRPLDCRTDLYALGLTLHEALTGRATLEGDTDGERMQAAVSQRILPPSTLRKEVPPELDAIVMALLERDPERRTATGQELRDQLLRLNGAAAPLPMGQQALANLVSAFVPVLAREATSPSAMSELDRPPLQVTPESETVPMRSKLEP